MPEAEGEVAGRLVVPVESSTKGFRKKLKEKLEAASEGLAAKVGLDVDEGDLREQIEAKVEAAAAGVKATIGIDVDAKTLRAKIEAAAAAAGANVNIGTSGALADNVAAEAAAAQGIADSAPVEVPVKAKRGLTLSVLKEWIKAQAAVSRKPVEVPVRARIRGRGMRTGLRIGIYAAIASLIQPAVGAIGQLLGGLTAMAGAIGPATGTLAAVPLGLSAIIQTAIGTKIALQGVGDAMGLLSEKQATLARGEEWTGAQAEQLEQALSELPPAARKVAREVVGLRKDWTDMRKVVQQRLFRQIAGDIKPLAEDLLPVLEKGLSGTADVLGRNTAAAIEFMRTPLFQRQFAGVMRQNNDTIDAGADALGNFGRGFLWFQRAAAPFQRRMDSVIESVGEWFLLTTRRNARNGDTAAFLDKAGDRLAQVWNITKQLGGGLRGIFRAGEDSGVRLLTTFETFLTDWREWVDSPEGQARIRRWFDNVEGGFKELSRLVGDSGEAMLKWAEDPKIEEMLRSIRTELGPALNEFLTQMSDTFGTSIIDLITELTRALNNAAPAIEILGDLTGALVDFLGVLNDLAEANPTATAGIMKILGALLVFKAGGRLLKGKGMVGGAVGGLLGLLGLGKGAKGAKGIDAAAKSTGRFSGVLGKLGRNPLLKRAGAVGGVITLIDILDSINREANGGNIDAFTGRLKEAGRVTGMTVKEVKSSLESGHLGKYAEDLGIDMDSLAEAIAAAGDSSGAYKTVIDRLNDTIEEGRNSLNPFKGQDGFKAKMVREQLAEFMAEYDKAIRDAKRKRKEFRNAMNITDRLLSPKPNKGVQPKPPVPKITPEFTRAVKAQGQKAADMLARSTANAARNSKVKVPPPNLNLSAIKKSAGQLGRITASASRNVGQVKAKATQASKAAAQSFKSVQETAQKWMGQTVSVTNKSMGQVVKGISSKKGPARGASQGVANATKQPMQGLAGPMRTAGQNAMAGFTAGIRAEGANAVAAARSVAAQVAAASRSELKIKSPSRVMMEVGRFVTEGFAKGITGSAAAVRKAQQGLTSMLIDGGMARDERRRFARETNKEFDRLESLARRRDRIAQRLSRAVDRLKVSKQDRKSIRESLVSGVNDFASIVGIADSNDGFASPSFLVSELTRRFEDTKAFQSGLATLRKRGLGKRAYKQLAEAGVEGAGQIVKQLMSASPTDLAQINVLQYQMSKAAKSLGAATNKVLAKAGKNASKGLINGLLSEQKRLNKAAAQMGGSMVRAVKKSLGIRSPSRVMAGVGGNTVDGLTVGMLRRQGAVNSAARRISADLARSLTPRTTYAESLHGATRKSASARDKASTAMLAPLVGELVINGKNAGEVRDGLEEAMFALRRIRQGGVHADRTS